MASFQCYRPAQETCETKCYDNSYGHKVSEMAGMVLKGNHHGHHANSQGHSYSQPSGYHHPDHTVSKTQTQCHCSQTQTYYPDHNVTKTHSTQCVSQSQGHQAMSHNQSNKHGHKGQHQPSHGMACHGKTEKKMKNKCEYKKKKSHCNKRRDGNRSCSDNSSGSDSD